jgi:serine/threonine protein kinase
LGRGSYGIVLRASYKKRDVAVKILDKSNNIKYKSLKHEANIINLDHENIIRILKIVDCKEYGAIIMERFDGKCLQNALENHKIDLIHRLYMLWDISKALVFCHSHGIIHADLKPQNVLVAVNVKTAEERGYMCKLFDFGCSTRLHLKHEGFENIGVS